MTAADIQSFATAFDEIFLLIGAAILIIEIVKGLFEKSFRGRGHLDMIASISTQVPSILIETFVLSLAYLGFILISQNYVTWTLPINAWTVGIALLVCDFVYYWEHRIAHEVRIFWTQHAVHHSSRHMNASVAVRFGPLEGVISVLFHLPLVFLGFPPALIFFGILVVLAYQTWIHTELIGKLGILDEFLNTPSNHRVHHGCDDKYIDKNYGGILMIWDRMFGTFQREDERPNYGLKRDFDSVNPITVWFSELPQFFADLRNAKSFGEVLKCLFGKPGWVPKASEATTEGK
ncbi:MAG: sterol desaturase family protein [Pseudomonadota bacterium]